MPPRPARLNVKASAALETGMLVGIFQDEIVRRNLLNRKPRQLVLGSVSRERRGRKSCNDRLQSLEYRTYRSVFYQDVMP